MQGFKSNSELVQKIFDELKEILRMTLLIREMILRGEFESLPDQLARREEKIKKLKKFLSEFGEKARGVGNFEELKKEIKAICAEILKIDTENTDNIRERMKEISKELQELIERKKLLNYLG